MSYRETGVLTIEELARKELLPSNERLRRGPVVILECPEEIPCNLCIYACPFKAISKDRIYSVPR
ncbi:MAG: ferredoxin, partial [Desulfurococcaceae archaeon]